MRNVLTIDVEDWFHVNGFNFPIDSWSHYEDRVVNNTFKILDVLEKYKVLATFFILGCVAKKFPQLVKEIANRGHEIGSHGGWHQLVSEQTVEEFREDIRFSKKVLEDITGKEIHLYRAPSWSINANHYELLECLTEEGFICDSSIQPFQTPLSGVAGAPHFPYYPIINGKRVNIIEFPPTVLKVKGIPIPFSGGFYLRAIPWSVISWALRKRNETGPGMIYIHPWEFDPDQPRVPVPRHIKFIHYYNLDSTKWKFEQLLKQFHFAPLGEIVKEGEYPSVPLTQKTGRVHYVSRYWSFPLRTAFPKRKY